MAQRPLYLIDSDAASNQLLSEMLAPQGFAVTAYTSGAEGLNAVLSAPPVMAILCLELGDMSGYVVCKKIKENAPTAQVPVIIMSKDATDKDFERHRKLKVAAQGYIRKPFETADILRKIEDLVGFNVSQDAYDSLEAKIDGMFETGTTDDELKLKEKEVERVQKEAEALRSELLKTKQQMGASADTDLSAKLLAMQTERDQLARRLQQREANAVVGEQLAALARERDELKSKSEEFKLNAELKFREYQGEIENLRGMLQEAQAAADQAAHFEQQIVQYKAELEKQLASKQSLENRYKSEIEQIREELTHVEEEAAGNTVRLEKRETELLQELESIREQTDMMREQYEQRLAETRESARRVLEEGLAALGS